MPLVTKFNVYSILNLLTSLYSYSKPSLLSSSKTSSVPLLFSNFNYRKVQCMCTAMVKLKNARKLQGKTSRDTIWIPDETRPKRRPVSLAETLVL